MRKSSDGTVATRQSARTLSLTIGATLVLLAVIVLFVPQRLAAGTPLTVRSESAAPEEESTEAPEEEASATPTAASAATPTAASTATPTAAGVATVTQAVTVTVSAPLTLPAPLTATNAPTATDSLMSSATLSTTSNVTATVRVRALNLRSGPGTTYARLGKAHLGATFFVFGKTAACAWFRIKTAQGIDAWVSGNPRFVSLHGACDDVPLLAPDVIPTPTRAPATSTPVVAAALITPANAATLAPVAATAAPTVTVVVTVTVAPPVDPAATPTVAPLVASMIVPTIAPVASPTSAPAQVIAEGPGFPPGTGCVQIGNHVGPELTISFTNLSTGESQQSIVPNNETRVYCMLPARYSVTADAPPPWNDINFELDVKLGEGVHLPLVAQP